MSKRTAQAIMLVLWIGKIVLHIYGLLDQQVEQMIDGVVAAVSLWMVSDAYHREPDGTKSVRDAK